MASAWTGPSGPATLDDVTSALFKKAEQTNPEDLMKEAKVSTGALLCILYTNY
jgi:hypothetical protein